MTRSPALCAALTASSSASHWNVPCRVSTSDQLTTSLAAAAPSPSEFATGRRCLLRVGTAQSHLDRGRQRRGADRVDGVRSSAHGRGHRQSELPSCDQHPPCRRHGHLRTPVRAWDADACGVRAHRQPHPRRARSEEHTSELQSLAYLVCRLLLEKKKREAEEKWIGDKVGEWISNKVALS